MNSISRRQAIAAAAFAPALLHAPAVLGQARPRLVVVGGGFGGAGAARHARDAYPQVDVTLVEPNRSYTTCPFSNLVLGGLRTIGSITHDYSGLARRGANIVHDRVVAVDPARRAVRLASGGELAYDRLIVAPGIEMRWGAIEG
jgi:sulfide dehydrogenase [flavocytochrome c] flavoprotein subunit